MRPVAFGNARIRERSHDARPLDGGRRRLHD
jgi:hypothetical protein